MGGHVPSALPPELVQTDFENCRPYCVQSFATLGLEGSFADGSKVVVSLEGSNGSEGCLVGRRKNSALNLNEEPAPKWLADMKRSLHDVHGPLRRKPWPSGPKTHLESI